MTKTIILLGWFFLATWPGRYTSAYEYPQWQDCEAQRAQAQISGASTSPHCFWR